MTASNVASTAPAAQQAPATAPFNWRAHLNVHPAAEFFPLMSEAELKELAEDISANGLVDPIVLWMKDDKLLLDGRNRLDAMALAGLLGVNKHGDLCDVKSSNLIKLQVFNDGDPYAIAVSFNVHRRHLTSEQKRQLLAKLFKVDPEKSNRQVAKTIGVDDKTAAKVRKDLERTAEIPQLKKTKGKDGKKRPAMKRSKVTEVALADHDPATSAAKRIGENAAFDDDASVDEATKHITKIGLRTVSRLKDGRVDRRLERSKDGIVGVLSSCELLGDIELLPQLSAKQAALLLEEMRKAFDGLRKLRAKLAERAMTATGGEGVQ